MADFVAVIRRAVDGLAENTPEMRVKVYERARGAVQRQLENMKPRPPEQMLQRQLDKLEVAIVEVEAEHAEALPAVAEFDAAPVVPVYEVVEEEADVAEISAPTEEPVAAEHHVEEPTQPVAPEPAHDLWSPEEPVIAQWQAPEEAKPVEAWHEAPVEEVVSAHAAVEPDAVPMPAEPQWEEPSRWPGDAHAEVHYAVDADTHQIAEDVSENPFVGDDRAFVAHTREEPLHAESEAHFDAIWTKPSIIAPPSEPEHLWIGEDPHDHKPLAAEMHPLPVKMPAVDEPFSWEAAVTEAARHREETVSTQPQPSANQFEDVDLFTDVHGATALKPAQPESNAWRDIEELNGYDAPGLSAANDSYAPDEISSPRPSGKSFRLEPKRRRFNIGTIAFILVCLAVVGGSGYAAWLNRDALNEMVSGLVSSARQTAKIDESKSTMAPTAADSNAPKPATSTASNATPATPPLKPTSTQGTAETKFTQRLLADGSEVNPGPAPAPQQQASVEGKSIAAQNVASTQPPAAGDTTTTGNVAATPTSPATPATSPTAPVGDGQKMFLYEERIGQTSPTAIQGSVVWTLKRDAGTDGRSEPSVQGAITVPERNMSALVTFKRNADPSLPASHLVEIVFSLPPNFEGGSIDSIQRIAMKATEQDRGDALIAVPAKITDDFHMVALNDYPDARAANLNLLRTRNWIDIPVTYRNGRRALITMEKGTTGTDAFETAIKEWTALGDVSTSQ